MTSSHTVTKEEGAHAALVPIPRLFTEYSHSVLLAFLGGSLGVAAKSGCNFPS